MSTTSVKTQHALNDQRNWTVTLCQTVQIIIAVSTGIVVLRVAEQTDVHAMTVLKRMNH